MKYLILEPKVRAIAPNIALMKWARWCELNGHEYQYVRGTVKPKIKPDIILMSCIFSYYSKRYEKIIDYYLRLFPDAKMTVGGVFPTLTPEWFDKRKWNHPFLGKRVGIYCGIHPDIENLPPKYNVEILDEDEGKRDQYKRDKIVLYASRGCTNKCGYCAVPKLEGGMKSFRSIKQMLVSSRNDLPSAKSVVLYDNNFTEHEFFDNIVDELKEFGLPVDIHGLHVDAFTRQQAKKFSELSWASQGKGGSPYLRFSFDKMKYADNIRRALGYVVDEKVKAGFFCYTLFNWIDSPSDFWKRIVISQDIVDDKGKTIFLFPQRFEPFMALERNTYVGKKWNSDLVRGVTRMYTFLHGFIPLTKTRNVFNWIGYTEEEFLDRAMKMATVKGYNLIKKDGIPPTTKELLKGI